MLYNVADSTGNIAEQLVRHVVVVDRTPPVISLIGDSVIKQELNEPYTDPGVEVVDNVDGDLTDSLDVQNLVDINEIGYE